MLFPSKKDPLVGVDIGSYYLKMVELNPTKRGFELKAVGVLELEPDTIVEESIEKPEVVVEALKTLIKTEKIKGKSAAVSIPGRALVVKKISLPAASEYNVRDLLSIEAEQYIPFEVSEASLDYHIISEGDAEVEGSQREVLLIASRREIVDNYKELVSQAGLNPVVVDVDVFALENGYEMNYEVEQDAIIALIDMGAALTAVSVLENGLTTFTRDVNFAGDMITYSLRDGLDVSQDMAEQLKRGVMMEGISPLKVKEILTGALEELCEEITNTFDLYKETSDNEVGMAWLTGGTARIKDIDRFMTEKLGIPVEITDPFKNIVVDEKVFDPEFINYIAPVAAVGVGLATRKFGDKL